MTKPPAQNLTGGKRILDCMAPNVVWVDSNPNPRAETIYTEVEAPKAQNLGDTPGHKGKEPKIEVEIRDIPEDDPRRTALTWCSDKSFAKIRQDWNDHLYSILPEEPIEGRHVVGNISEDLAVELLKSLRSLPKLEWDKYDCNPEYVAAPMGKQREVALWKAFLPYLDFKEEQYALVKLICKELQPTIESYLGTGFRIINTKAFETLPGSNYFGPNKTHRDSQYPNHTYKAFVYLTGAGGTIGSTKIAWRENKHTPVKHAMPSGPPGTFLLFNPVNTSHWGVVPKERNRAILELILVPSHKTEINPTFNGTNSTHPISI